MTHGCLKPRESSQERRVAPFSLCSGGRNCRNQRWLRVLAQPGTPCPLRTPLTQQLLQTGHNLEAITCQCIYSYHPSPHKHAHKHGKIRGIHSQLILDMPLVPHWRGPFDFYRSFHSFRVATQCCRKMRRLQTFL